MLPLLAAHSRRAPLLRAAAARPVSALPPPPPPSTPSPAPAKGGALAALKENGSSFAALYGAFYIAPLALSFAAFRAGDNFGLDPLVALEALHAKETVFGALGLPPTAAPEPWQTSAMLAYIFNTVAELARLPAAIALAPRLKKALEDRKRAVR